eukprot:7930570-Pyramimonas_sp.AAC.1
MRYAISSADPGQSPRTLQTLENWNNDGRPNDQCSTGSCGIYFQRYSSMMELSSLKTHDVHTVGQNIYSRTWTN